MPLLYQRVDGVLRYHEAWTHAGIVYEHSGVVGQRSDVREHKLADGADSTEAMWEVLRGSSNAGFQPMRPEALVTLAIEYPIEDLTIEQGMQRGHAVEKQVNDTLGWTALGRCLSGDLRPTTLEILCSVVDFQLAKRTLEAELAGTDIANYLRIYEKPAET